MSHMPIEELMKRCSSAYRLVILAARRAKELTEGAPPLVDEPSRRVTTIALQEILQGKVLYKAEEEEGRKRGRGKKEKVEKRKKG